MIFDVATRVDRDLRARKFHGPVTYGPERSKRQGLQAAVVFARDRERGDKINPPIATKLNPRAPFTRAVGGVVEVYTKSPKAGATAADHEDMCDRLADAVLCSMYRICKTAALPLAILDSRMLEAKEFNDVEQWACAATRIRFAVTVLVSDVDYLGEGADEGVVFDVAPPLVTSEGLPDFDPVGA